MQTLPPPHPQVTNDCCVPITEELWDRILRLYLRTYRGPTADADLKRELADYSALKRDPNAKVEPGRYVRYLSRGIVESELRRGGYVVKCTSKSVHLQDGRRHWRVSRTDNFIFVRNEDAPIFRKTMIRLLAEEAIRKDNDNNKKLPKPTIAEPPPPPSEPPRTKLKANFL